MRRLAARAGMSVAIKIGYALLTAAATVVVARLLGAAAFGQYSFLIALISVLALPAQAGIPTLVLRETARQIGQGRGSEIWGLWGWALRRTLVAAAIIAIGLLLVRALWSGLLVRYSWLEVVLAAVAIIVLPLSALRGAALRGLQKVNLGQLPESIVRPATFLLALGCVAIFFRDASHRGLTIALLAFLSSLIVAAAIGGFWLLQHAPPRDTGLPRPAAHVRASWSASLLPLTLLASIGSAELDVLVVGLWLDDVQLGIYKVTQQTILVAAFVPTAINAVFMPIFAREFARADRSELQQLVSRASATLLLALIPASVVLLAFGEAILSWAFGPQFKGGHLALSALIIGQLINMVAGPVASILNMTGHERKSLAAFVSAVLLLLAAAGPLISRWGVFGAAIAAAGAAATANILMCWFVYRTLGLRTIALNGEMRGVISGLIRRIPFPGRT